METWLYILSRCIYIYIFPTVTHTHSFKAAEGQGTHCHTLSEVSHTGDSGRMAGRGELSTRRKIYPPQILPVWSAGHTEQKKAHSLSRVTQQTWVRCQWMLLRLKLDRNNCMLSYSCGSFSLTCKTERCLIAGTHTGTNTHSRSW